ncbi:MAG: adenylyltransferase/cytidyltransferase family protein [Halobacteriales archaeon]|nr:adenylyltransferase/cytidyltransferase family protein [Halobacteriales archaeon]
MRGLVVGRFQPLHNGHVALIRHAQERCGEVAVALGSTQAKPSLRNPFSVAERHAMLAATFPSAPVFDVPDLHDAGRWVEHALAITGPVDRVFGNDGHTLDLFEMAHVPVERPGLVERTANEATAIRALLAEDDPAWRKAVPPPVARLLLEWDAPRRLRLLA